MEKDRLYEAPEATPFTIKVEKSILTVSGPQGDGEIEPIGYEQE